MEQLPALTSKKLTSTEFMKLEYLLINFAIKDKWRQRRIIRRF
jgi:hypothetical protein